MCHSDIHVADGHFGGPLPVVLGHEVVGELRDGTEPKLAHDSSTNALIRRYRAANDPS